MNIELSKDQTDACKLVIEKLKSDRIASLHGYAGSGKTTLAKTIAKDFGEAFYHAFTGKAADVLRRKTGFGTTIHRSFYNMTGKAPDGRPRFKAIPPLDGQITRGIIVLDEASMIPKDMLDNILAHVAYYERLHLLIIGDPFQLPPVNAQPHPLAFETPTAKLTTVHRQVANDPILRLATSIRKSERPDGHGITTTHCETIDDGHLASASMILCGRNATRKSLNRHMRRVLGYEAPTPSPGERLVCLKNNHQLGLYNGSTYTVRQADRTKDIVFLELVDSDGNIYNTEALAETFKTGIAKHEGDYDEFDFGYAITVHKSQGSEFPDVILANEAVGDNSDLKRRWMYTGVTRAKRKLTIMNVGGRD